MPSRSCRGTNRMGNPCQRIPPPGSPVCASHGGKAPQTRRRAAERVAEQKALKLMNAYSPASPPLGNPVAELLQVAGEIKAFKDFLAGRVADMRAEEWRYTDDKGGEQLRAEIVVYERALDRTAKILLDLAKLGLEERLVRISEQQGAIVAQIIRASLDAHLDRVLAVLGGSPEADTIRHAWPSWMTEIVPQQIAAATGGG